MRTSMTLKFKSGLLKSFLFSTAVTFLPFSAFSQAVLEEVLVTATRRGTTDIQTTPVSVSALDEDTLDEMLLFDLGDVAAAVPNLVHGNAPAFSSFNPSLRGVGKDGIILYVESPVGVAVDDFVLMSTQTQNIEPFDIEAIEVLRGPQGTLFGKNTTAGLVSIRTKKPKLEERSIEARASYASFDSWETKFAGNFGTDTLAIRAAGIYQKNDGYYNAGKTSTSFDPIILNNGGPFTPETFTGDGRDLAGVDKFSGRIKLLWEPNEDFSALATYEIVRDNSDSPVVVKEAINGLSFFPNLGFHVTF